MKRELLKSYLKNNCLGQNRIASSAVLEHALHMGPNTLQHSVNRLRQEGVPIASSGHGYFYAQNAGELYATIRWLKKMVATLEKTIQGREAAMARFKEGGDSG